MRRRAVECSDRADSGIILRAPARLLVCAIERQRVVAAGALAVWPQRGVRPSAGECGQQTSARTVGVSVAVRRALAPVAREAVAVGSEIGRPTVAGHLEEERTRVQILQWRYF